MGRAGTIPPTPPGWEDAPQRLVRLVDPSGEAAAWVVGDLGANCIAYAVRRPDGWVQVLDPGTPGALAGRPTRFGCPVLFPFPGHARGARYRWGGVERALPPNGAGSGDYTHGFAPRLPWRVEGASPDAIACEFLTTRDLPGGTEAAGYPFAVRLRLAVRLADRALTIALTATNEDTRAAPLGLGLHPYIAIAALGGVRAAVRAELPGHAEHRLAGPIPTGERLAVAGREVGLPPLGETLLVPRTDLGPRPEAILRGQADGPRVRLACIEGVRDLLLFAPPTENSVSLEPLATAPGAASQPEGHPDGLLALAPGATHRLIVTISAE